MSNTTRSFSFRKISVLLIALLLAGCTLPGGPPAADGGAPGIQIVQPQEGAQFQVGDVVEVVSTFSDPGGARGVVLEVNGVATRNDAFNSPMFQGNMNQPWRPSQEGAATLCAYLSISDGQLLRSNCVIVTIGSASQDAPTPEVVFTIVPELTFTPASTLTLEAPTLTSTPGAPTVTATQDANCRAGPDTGYAVQTNLPTGQSAPIVGRNADSSWWVVNVNGIECWIWGEIVNVEGDTSGTAVIAPPPLPTATPTNTPTPLAAPTPIAPSGTLDCASSTGGVTLVWSAVTHPNGIDHYEWQLNGPISDSGDSAITQATTKSLSCAGAVFQWRVRAVDGKGNAGPWSNYMQFTIP